MDKEQSSGKRKSTRSPPYALFNLLVIVVALIYGAYYQMYLSRDATQSEQVVVTEGDDDLERIPLFTAEELKKFDGVGKCQLTDNLSVISETLNDYVAVLFHESYLSG